MTDGRYTYRHKPLGQNPHPKEEHVVRFDNRERAIVVMMARKTRDGMAYEIRESLTLSRHHASYDRCEACEPETFARVLQTIKETLQI